MYIVKIPLLQDLFVYGEVKPTLKKKTLTTRQTFVTIEKCFVLPENKSVYSVYKNKLEKNVI